MPMGWGALAGAVIGGVSSASSSRKANQAMTNANNQSIEEQRRQFELMRSDSSPYRNVGSSALNRLSDLYNLDRQYDVAAPTKAQFTGQGSAAGTPWQAFNHNVDPVDAAVKETLHGLFGKKKGGGNNSAPVFDEAGYNSAMGKYQQDLDTFNHRERGVSLFEKDPGYDFRLNQGIQGMDRSANARGVGLSGGALQQLNRYNQDYASNEFTNYANRLSALAGVGQASTNSAAQLGQANANSISGLLSQNGMNRGNMYQSSYGGINNAIQGGLSNYMFYDYMNKNPFGSRGSPSSDMPGSGVDMSQLGSGTYFGG